MHRTSFKRANSKLLSSLNNLTSYRLEHCLRSSLFLFENSLFYFLPILLLNFQSILVNLLPFSFLCLPLRMSLKDLSSVLFFSPQISFLSLLSPLLSCLLSLSGTRVVSEDFFHGSVCFPIKQVSFFNHYKYRKEA